MLTTRRTLSERVCRRSQIRGQTTASSQHMESLEGLRIDHNRWYDASTGRWISEDPIGFAAGDTNEYRYVGNSPENATDPGTLPVNRSNL